MQKTILPILLVLVAVLLMAAVAGGLLLLWSSPPAPVPGGSEGTASSPTATPAEPAEPQALRLRGHVVTAQGFDVPGARVVATASGGSRYEGETDAGGKFALTVEERALHTLRISAPGYNTREEQVRPSPAIPRYVLRAPWQVAGRVLDATAEPASGAEVVVMLPPDHGGNGMLSEIARATTDASGVFRLSMDERADSHVMARHPVSGLSAVVALEDLTPEQRADLELIVQRPGGLAGRVLNSYGEPVPATVIAKPTTGSTGSFALVDSAGGDFDLDLAPGFYRVLASAPDGRSGSLDGLPVTSGRRLEDLVIVLREGEEPAAPGRIHVTGFVTRFQDQRVMEGVRVAVTDGAGELYEETTSDSGRFAFRNVIPGELELRVEHESHRVLPWGAAALRRVSEEDLLDLPITIVETAPLAGTVVNGASEPVRDVRVQALAGARSLIPQATEGASLDSASTDGGGAFSFEHLPAGAPLRLVFMHPQYVTELRDDLRAPRDNLRVVLAPGGGVAGRVLDSNGEAVTGATLRAALVPPWPHQIVPETTSGEFGEYEITGLPEGDVVVTAEWQGRLGESAPVSITPGEVTREVDITLRPAFSRAGRVVDATGNPVPGASVAATLQPERTGDWRIHAGGAAQTDEEGRFQVVVPEDGPYTVGADHPAFTGVMLEEAEAGAEDLTLTLQPPAVLRVRATNTAQVPVQHYTINLTRTQPLSGEIVLAPAPEAEGNRYINSASGQALYSHLDAGIYAVHLSSPRYAPLTLTHKAVPAGEETVLEAVLSAGAVLSGTVLRGAGEQPVSNAVLELRPSREFATLLATSGTAYRTTSDARGRFLLEKIPPGNYDLLASHPRLGTGQVEDLDLREGEEVVVVRLNAGGRIVGHVYDPEQNPIEGAVLSTFAGRDKPARTATTNPAGEYALENVPAGHLTVTCRLPEGGEALLRSVEISLGETVTLNFGGEGVRLYGTVTSEQGPVAGVSLRLRPADSSRTFGRVVVAQSEQNGDYEFPTSLPPGDWLLTAMMNQTAVVFESVTLPMGAGSVRYDVRVPSSSISGRVIAQTDRKPVEGASVVVEVDAAAAGGAEYAAVSGNWGFAGEDITDAAGRFRIDGAPLGRVRVRAEARGFAPVTTTPSLRAGDRDIENLILELPPQSGVVGTVVEAGTGRPLADITVSAYHSEGGRLILGGSTRSEGDGSYAIEGLFEGNWHVMATGPGYAAASEPSVTVPESNVATLDIELTKPSGGLVISVQDAAAQFVTGARIRVWTAQGGIPVPRVTHGGTAMWTEAFADNDGMVRWEGLAPGSYVVEVNAVGYQTAQASASTHAGEMGIVLVTLYPRN